MAYDWKNVDWSALLKSQVVVGSVVTVITSGAAIAGHNLPNSMQSQLTDSLTQLFQALSVLAGLYTAFHRVTAQPEGQTVILPKKDDQSQPPKGN